MLLETFVNSFLINEEGKILLVKNTDQPSGTGHPIGEVLLSGSRSEIKPNTYSSLLEAAQQSLIENLRVKATDLKQVGEIERNYGYKDSFITKTSYFVATNWEGSLSPRPGLEAKWVDLKDPSLQREMPTVDFKTLEGVVSAAAKGTYFQGEQYYSQYTHLNGSLSLDLVKEVDINKNIRTGGGNGSSVIVPSGSPQFIQTLSREGATYAG